MVTLSEIQAFVNEIAEGYHPEKVYLFGSYANNTANDDSDIDLFIIKSTNAKKAERNIQVREAIKTYPYVGMDIIVYTPEELKRGMQDIVNIGKEAIKTGKLLYERVWKMVYPDLLDDLTVEDAKQAYQNAVTIKEFVLKYFFQ